MTYYINTYHSTHEWNNIVKKIPTHDMRNIKYRSQMVSSSHYFNNSRSPGRKVTRRKVITGIMPYLYIHYLYYISDMRLIWKSGMLYNFYPLFMELGLIFSKLRIYWYMYFIWFFIFGSSLIHLQFIQFVFNWVDPQN